jgi:PadR family transcriptional regulator PadR
MTKCEMKGFLSFIILWLLHKKKMTGAEIARELEKRKGTKPSPGTVYPVLKDLKSKGLICDKDKKYSLTPSGKKELARGIHIFIKTFYDFSDIKSCNCRE